MTHDDETKAFKRGMLAAISMVLTWIDIADNREEMMLMLRGAKTSMQFSIEETNDE